MPKFYAYVIFKKVEKSRLSTDTISRLVDSRLIQLSSQPLIAMLNLFTYRE